MGLSKVVHRDINNIADRLEKIRRGASGVTDDYLECSPVNSEMVSGGSDMQLQHDSAESSVEGKNEISVVTTCTHLNTLSFHTSTNNC